jgi:hypothetical protein
VILDLSALRMGLDEYDAAPNDTERDLAWQRLRNLLTVGLLRVMVAAIDDPNRPGADDQP